MGHACCVGLHGKGRNDAGEYFVVKYKTGRLLGQGAFGVVREARLRRDANHVVAVKTVTKKLVGTDPLAKKQKALIEIERQLQEQVFEFSEDRDLMVHMRKSLIVDLSQMTKQSPLEEIKKEIRVMNMFSHPNIMQIHDVFESKYQYRIVLTKAYGDLRVRRPSAGFAEADLVRYSADLMRAIAHLHDKLILHRDIKPDNLALSSANLSEASLIVSDFGLASELEAGQEFLPQQKRWVGTLVYLAPECFRGIVGKSADNWAAGCSILWCITVRDVASTFRLVRDHQSSTAGKEERRDKFERVMRNVDAVEAKFAQGWPELSAQLHLKGKPDPKRGNPLVLLEQLLQPKHEYRMTAQQALLDPWLAAQVEEHEAQLRKASQKEPRAFEAAKPAKGRKGPVAATVVPVATDETPAEKSR